MRLLKRIIAIFAALLLLAGVIWLGVLSGIDPKFVVWFGIASAIAAPVGLSLLGYAFTMSKSELIERLAKLPEIDRLITEAKTQEEKVKRLEAEYSRLVEIVRLESRRQAAHDRISSLEGDAARILGELKTFDAELKDLDVQIGKSPVSAEIHQLRERIRARQRGDIILRFGSRTYQIDRAFLDILPFGFGKLVLPYFRLLEKIGQPSRTR